MVKVVWTRMWSCKSQNLIQHAESFASLSGSAKKDEIEWTCRVFQWLTQGTTNNIVFQPDFILASNAIRTKSSQYHGKRFRLTQFTVWVIEIHIASSFSSRCIISRFLSSPFSCDWLIDTKSNTYFMARFNTASLDIQFDCCEIYVNHR